MFHLGWFLGHGFAIQDWRGGPWVGSMATDWKKSSSRAAQHRLDDLNAPKRDPAAIEELLWGLSYTHNAFDFSGIALMGEAMEEVGGDGFLLSPVVNRRHIAELSDGLAPALRKQVLSATVTTTPRSATTSWSSDPTCSISDGSSATVSASKNGAAPPGPGRWRRSG